MVGPQRHVNGAQTEGLAEDRLVELGVEVGAVGQPGPLALGAAGEGRVEGGLERGVVVGCRPHSRSSLREAGAEVVRGAGRRLGLEPEALEPPPERRLQPLDQRQPGREGEEVGREQGLLALEREVEGGDETLRIAGRPPLPLQRVDRDVRHGATERQADQRPGPLLE